MKLRSTLLSVLAISSFSFSAFASLGGSDQISNSVRPGIYKAQTADELLPSSWIMDRESKAPDNTFPNNDNLSMSVDAYESFYVTELSPNQISVTIFRPQEEVLAGNVPEQMILSRAEFDRSALRFLADGTVDQLPLYESGIVDSQTASRHGGGRIRVRAHHFSGGNIVGRHGNCVAVFHMMTGLNTIGNGKDIAPNLLRTGKYERTSLSFTRGVVCSYRNRWGGAGHVGTADGRCLQPVYPTKTYCGDPGDGFILSLCVKPRGQDI